VLGHFKGRRATDSGRWASDDLRLTNRTLISRNRCHHVCSSSPSQPRPLYLISSSNPKPRPCPAFERSSSLARIGQQPPDNGRGSNPFQLCIEWKSRGEGERLTH
jgi:hypothetical protein